MKGKRKTKLMRNVTKTIKKREKKVDESNENWTKMKKSKRGRREDWRGGNNHLHL